MSASPAGPPVLKTSAGEIPLQEYRLRMAGREWAVLHTGAILTHADESHFFAEQMGHLPYGVALWPASIALAHEIASRPEDFQGKAVLELGAGTGLPGIVAASLGARVVQTDRHEGAMSVCRRNGERNGVDTVQHRVVDWTEWKEEDAYDWIIGADVLYSEAMHPHLLRIFESSLDSGGRILLSDPFRGPSFRLLEAMEQGAWKISLSKWNVGEERAPRAVGVYELVPPG